VSLAHEFLREGVDPTIEWAGFALDEIALAFKFDAIRFLVETNAHVVRVWSDTTMRIVELNDPIELRNLDDLFDVEIILYLLSKLAVIPPDKRRKEHIQTDRYGKHEIKVSALRAFAKINVWDVRTYVSFFGGPQLPYAREGDINVVGFHTQSLHSQLQE